MNLTFCDKCGAELPQNAKFCQTCGAVSHVIEPTKNRPTRAWYLMPIFFSILGGIIGYFAVRNDDRKFANRLFIVGIVLFLVGFIGTMLFFGALFYAFLHSPP